MKNNVILKRTIIISAIIIIVDQILKMIAIKLCSDSNIEIIKNVLYFSETKNVGIAFSLNKGNLKNIIISSVIILFILRYLFTQQQFLNKITVTCLDLVLAGGISNLIDRILRGGVIDFIKILDFPIFNIADIMVVVGWALFAFYIIKFEITKR